jgi:AraC-like DNA-binding protein
LLEELGQDAAEVLAEAGVEPSLLADPENTIPFATVGRLLQHCEKHTGCENFGLLLGEQGGTESLGVVGLLAQHAPNVATALRDIILHLHLHDRGASPTLSASNGVGVLGYAIYEQNVVGTAHIYDAAIAIAFNIMRELCGPAWAPTEVMFCHAKPLDIKRFRRFFRSPLRFDAEQTALVFASSWLKQPVLGANPRVRAILEAEIERLEEQFPEDLPHRLRYVLRNLLVSGRGSIAEVAQLFALHRRTLNRRLRAEGTTFKQLADEVRFEIAHQLLRDTKMPLANIAALLDYADAASFSRAFRRWSGSTPGAWRQSLQNGRTSNDGAMQEEQA